MWPCKHEETLEKTFFMKAFIVDPYVSGNVELGAGLEDYAWATKAQVPEYLEGTEDPAFLAFLEKVL